MAAKRKLSKEQYEALGEGLQELYVEKDGEYFIQLEGEDDSLGALKRAKDREAEERKRLQKENKELQAKIEGIDELDARKRGDIETLEKSWEQKNEKLKSDLESKIASKDAFIKNQLVDSVAKDIANEISTSPALILPHIRSRLTADMDAESPTTKVLDAEGKPSAQTVKELAEEFRCNKDYAPIIVGSKASGSGAPKNSPIAPIGDGDKPADLSKMDPKSLAAVVQPTIQE